MYDARMGNFRDRVEDRTTFEIHFIVVLVQRGI